MKQAFYYHLWRIAPPGSRFEYWAWLRWLATGWQKPRRIDQPTEDTTSYDPRLEAIVTAAREKRE